MAKTDQPYQIGDTVDLRDWDATEPEGKHYGLCRVEAVWSHRVCQSGWMLRCRSIAQPIRSIELCSGWVHPAGATGERHMMERKER